MPQGTTSWKEHSYKQVQQWLVHKLPAADLYGMSARYDPARFPKSAAGGLISMLSVLALIAVFVLNVVLFAISTQTIETEKRDINVNSLWYSGSTNQANKIILNPDDVVDLPSLEVKWTLQSQFFEQEPTQLQGLKVEDNTGKQRVLSSTTKQLAKTHAVYRSFNVPLQSFDVDSSTLLTPNQTASFTLSNSRFATLLQDGDSLGIASQISQGITSFEPSEAILYVRVPPSSISSIQACQLQVGVVPQGHFTAMSSANVNENRLAGANPLLPISFVDATGGSVKVSANDFHGLYVVRSAVSQQQHDAIMQAPAADSPSGSSATVSQASGAEFIDFNDWRGVVSYVSNFNHTAEKTFCTGSSVFELDWGTVVSGSLEGSTSLTINCTRTMPEAPFQALLTSSSLTERINVTALSRQQNGMMTMTLATPITRSLVHSPSPPPATPVPSAWHCDPKLYADGAVCDCSCGSIDPDCHPAISPSNPVAGCQQPVAGALTVCDVDAKCHYTEHSEHHDSHKVSISNGCAHIFFSGESFIAGRSFQQGTDQPYCPTCPGDAVFGDSPIMDVDTGRLECGADPIVNVWPTATNMNQSESQTPNVTIKATLVHPQSYFPSGWNGKIEVLLGSLPVNHVQVSNITLPSKNFQQLTIASQSTPALPFLDGIAVGHLESEQLIVITGSSLAAEGPIFFSESSPISVRIGHQLFNVTVVHSSITDPASSSKIRYLKYEGPPTQVPSNRSQFAQSFVTEFTTVGNTSAISVASESFVSFLTLLPSSGAGSLLFFRIGGSFALRSVESIETPAANSSARIYLSQPLPSVFHTQGLEVLAAGIPRVSLNPRVIAPLRLKIRRNADRSIPSTSRNAPTSLNVEAALFSIPTSKPSAFLQCPANAIGSTPTSSIPHSLRHLRVHENRTLTVEECTSNRLPAAACVLQPNGECSLSVGSPSASALLQVSSALNNRWVIPENQATADGLPSISRRTKDDSSVSDVTYTFNLGYTDAAEEVERKFGERAGAGDFTDGGELFLFNGALEYRGRAAEAWAGSRLAGKVPAPPPLLKPKLQIRVSPQAIHDIRLLKSLKGAKRWPSGEEELLRLFETFDPIDVEWDMRSVGEEHADSIRVTPKTEVTLKAIIEIKPVHARNVFGRNSIQEWQHRVVALSASKMELSGDHDNEFKFRTVIELVANARPEVVSSEVGIKDLIDGLGSSFGWLVFGYIFLVCVRQLWYWQRLRKAIIMDTDLAVSKAALSGGGQAELDVG